MKLIDCTLIGVCVIIRLNIKHLYEKYAMVIGIADMVILSVSKTSELTFSWRWRNKNPPTLTKKTTKKKQYIFAKKPGVM